MCRKKYVFWNKQIVFYFVGFLERLQQNKPFSDLHVRFIKIGKK